MEVNYLRNATNANATVTHTGENSKQCSMKDECRGLQSNIQFGSVIRENVELLRKPSKLNWLFSAVRLTIPKQELEDAKKMMNSISRKDLPCCGRHFPITEVATDFRLE